MKSIKALIIIVFIFAVSSVNAQNDTKKEKDKTEFMFGIFTVDEYSNIHMWFIDQIKEMRLTEELQNKYDYLFGKHLGKIGRPEGRENKDKVLPEAEYIESIKENIPKLNSSVAPILSENQNKKHLEIMAEFEKILINKLQLKKE